MYKTFQFKELNQAIYSFFTQELSSFYCMLTKDRLYCDQADSERRRRAQGCMQLLTFSLAHLIAPILPHTAEETLNHLFPDSELNDIHCNPFIDFTCHASKDWEHVISVRQTVLKKLEEEKEKGCENPLDCGVVIPNNNGILTPFSSDLADILGVSTVSFSENTEEITIEDRRHLPRCERS